MALKFCPNCGKKNENNSNFCSNCGTNLQEKTNSVFEIQNGVLIKYNGKDAIVHVPSSVKKIGSYVFPATDAIFNKYAFVEKVYLPYGIKEIGESAFRGVTTLSFVDLPSTIETIGSYAFEETYALKKIAIPPNVKVIKSCTFRRSLGLEQVFLPEGLERIEDYAFYECVELKMIKIPRSVKYIGSNVFGFTRLKDIEYGGTKREFDALCKDRDIFCYSNRQTVNLHCSDGTYPFERN